MYARSPLQHRWRRLEQLQTRHRYQHACGHPEKLENHSRCECGHSRKRNRGDTEEGRSGNVTILDVVVEVHVMGTR